MLARDLFKPYSFDRFVRQVWGRKYLHAGGDPSRFDFLFSWHALNGILRAHRLEPPRIRIADLNVEAKTYVRHIVTPKGHKIPRLIPGELRRLLSDGATLVVDAVEEIHPPVAQAALELEHSFRAPVQANLYVGWKSSQGFGTHWDPHDVIVLQVYGRKKWRVHGVSRPHPIDRDSEPLANVPSPPAWEGELVPGDALYIPRGWWHDAASVGVPTLHLTFGIHSPTGVDYLQAMIDVAAEAADVRKDLPRFGTAKQKRRHAEKLKRALLSAMSRMDIDSYLERMDEMNPGRGSFSLPWAASSDSHPLTPDLFVRTTFLRPPSVVRVRGTDNVRLRAGGREWTIPQHVGRLLQSLAGAPPRRVADIAAAHPDVPESLLLQICTELLKQGAMEVAFRSSGDGSLTTVRVAVASPGTPAGSAAGHALNSRRVETDPAQGHRAPRPAGVTFQSGAPGTAPRQGVA